jgi:hypothetical protein
VEVGWWYQGGLNQPVSLQRLRHRVIELEGSKTISKVEPA